jgi:transposase-like protein
MDTQVKTLQQAIRHFSDDNVCIDTVAYLRWPDGVPTCPKCAGKSHYYLATQKRWKCKACGRQFSVKVGTIFEDSPIPLDKWLTALWMLINCKNGVSSYEIAKAVGITQKSAWFVLHRLRFALKDRSFAKLGGPESGPVEVDETWVGGKVKNIHRSRVTKYMLDTRGQNFNKTIVQGILDRDVRKVRAKVVPNVKRETLQKEVLSAVKYGSKVYTDEAVGYDSLHYRFVHEVVNHSETYVNGQVHTNGIENFWTLLKRTLRGTYVAVEPFHLDSYLDEQVFRYNHRKDENGNKMTDADRFNAALPGIAGRRLTFAELTGKNGSQENF